MKGDRIKAFFVITLMCVSCATTGRLESEQINTTTAVNAPRDIIEDASKVQEASLFSKSMAKAISEKLNSKSKFALRDVQNIICDGKIPRVKPTYHVHLVLPKPNGVAINEASEARMQTLIQVRTFLKTEFFWSFSEIPTVRVYSGSNRVVEDKSAIFNDDFGRCYDGGNGIECKTFDESKNQYEKIDNNGVTAVNIPVVRSRDRSVLEKEYRETSYSPPDIARLSLGRAETQIPPLLFMGLVFPNSQSVLLTAKVTDLLKVTKKNGEFDEGFKEKVGMCKEEICGTTDSDRNNNLLQRILFTPSEVGWKNEKNSSILYPLHLIILSDLALLEKYFTFVFPEAVVKKLRWGFAGDYKTTPFTIAEDIAYRQELWKLFLSRQTEVKEAVQPNGDTAFETSLDLSLFCLDSAPVADLMSK